MQQKPTDDATPLGHDLARELESVLHTLQQRIASGVVPAVPEGGHLALVHLVQGLSVEDWKRIAEETQLHGWLALPLDEAQGLPLKALYDTLEELAYQRDHDTLTGLANRRYFDRHLAMELTRSARTKSPLSLVMLDIDHFKSINDTYGHAVGDIVLADLGGLLSRSLRAYDLAARVGGEEFALVLPGATARQAQDLASRILDEFRKCTFTATDGATFSATFSAGVTTAFAHIVPIRAHELYTQADDLLYEAKRQGRNRVLTIAPLTKVNDSPTLVQAEEKQFLFTGTDL